MNVDILIDHLIHYSFSFGTFLASRSGGRLYDFPSGVIQQVGGSWLCFPIVSVTLPALFILNFAGQHLLKKYQQYQSWLPYAFLYINLNVWFWYMNNFEFPLVLINIPENIYIDLAFGWYYELLSLLTYKEGK